MGVVDPLVVVLAWAGMLYGLPGEDVSDGVVAPAAQPRKVCGGIVEGEGSVDEGDVIAVEESVRDMGGHVWSRGELGVGSAVDAMQQDLAVVWRRETSGRRCATGPRA